MKDNRNKNPSQLFNFVQDSYLERTSRPIYAIVFLLPFIVFYELGTIFIRTDVLSGSPVLVVSFVWLEKFLEYIGFGGKFAFAAPPLVVLLILIALQLTSRKRWRVWFSDFWPMSIESALLAVPLIVLTLLLNTSVGPQGNMRPFENTLDQRRASVNVSAPDISRPQIETTTLSKTEGDNIDTIKNDSLLVKIVTSMGAGIYEELVFRLILICGLMLLFQDIMRIGRQNSIVLSVLVSAALFSAHHHIDFLSGQVNQRDLFNWSVFIFRTIAGVYFAVLFAIRGFGITAGTHIFYDIIAVSVNALFFQT